MSINVNSDTAQLSRLAATTPHAHAQPRGAHHTCTCSAGASVAVSHGGQVVLSVEAAELLHGYLPPDCSLKDLGQHRMKGMTQRAHLFQLLAPGLPASFPALATLDTIPNNFPVQLSWTLSSRER